MLFLGFPHHKGVSIGLVSFVERSPIFYHEPYHRARSLLENQC
ncbi:hypothetical protein [Nostoc flagelliforme]